MFQRILVPLDGSPRAERALPVAIRLARASGGTVVLMRVAGTPTTLAPVPAPYPGTLRAMLDTDLAEARAYLEALTGGSGLSDVHTEINVIEGPTANRILWEAEAGHVDLIVLCSHGYTGFKRWALGSVAEKVAHYAPVPVLLLREGGPALVGTSLHAQGPLRALVPLDGSARARAALMPAAQLVMALSAPDPGALHLVRVVVLPEAARISESEREAILHDARQSLREAAGQLHQELLTLPTADSRLAITWSVTLDDDCATGILRVAEVGEESLDMEVSTRSNVIAMATHGYSEGEWWAMGGVTRRVLSGTKLPLLLLRPAAYHTAATNLPAQDEGIAG